MGCFWQPIFAAIQNLFRSVPLIGAIVQIAAGVLCAGPLAPVCVGLAATLVTGITSGKLGLALRAGFISAVTAWAFTGVGDLTAHGSLDFGSDAHLFNIAGHALVGCASAVARRSTCGSGALSGAAGSLAGPLLTGLNFESKLVATSVLGGLASVAGGGKFANGAVTAAFGYLFNEAYQFGCNRYGMCGGGGGAPGGGGMGAAPGLGAAVGAGAALSGDTSPEAISKNANEGGTATIWQDDIHMSIEIRSGGESLHTEQLGEPGEMTEISTTGRSGQVFAVIPLPNAQGALEFSRSMVGQEYGLYDFRYTSCYTYCGDVLRAGGLNVPTQSKDVFRFIEQYKK
jgi:hypothetical protein